MAVEKNITYKEIPKLSKVSVPIKLAAGVDASTVSVALTVPSGLSIITAAVSAGSFAGSTWTIGTTVAGTDYTAVVDLLVTENYSAPLTVVATTSTEAEDQLAGDNIMNVIISESAESDVIAPSFTDGLSYYDGSAAVPMKSDLQYSVDGSSWRPTSIVGNVTNADAGNFNTVTVSVPAAVAAQVTAGTITATINFVSANNQVIVLAGAAAVNAAAEANDGTASSSSIGLDNAVARNISDGAAFTSTLSGVVTVSFEDAGGIIDIDFS